MLLLEVLITETVLSLSLVTYANLPKIVEGVTVMVAVTGPNPGLTAVNEGILPVPLAGSPIVGLLFTQLKVTAEKVLVKFTGLVPELSHTT